MAQVIFPAIVVPGSTANPAEPTSPSDGQIWVDTDGTAPTTVVTRWSKTPTNGTTTLSGTDDTTNTLAYTPGYEQVFLNGVLLSRTADYTATTGTSVVLTTGTITSDIVEVICPLQVAYTDTITTAAAATTYVAKALTTTTGDIIYASAANTPARLGIGSAGQVLNVASGIPAWTTPSGGFTMTSFTPTFTNLTLGNGTAVAYSGFSGDIAVVQIQVTFGTTTSTSGNVSFGSYPHTARTTITDPNNGYTATTGTAIFTNASYAYAGMALVGGTGGRAYYFDPPAPPTFTSIRPMSTGSSPIGWTTGAVVQFSAFYWKA